MKRQPNKWLIFSGLAFQIAFVMYLMISLGEWIEFKIEIETKTPTLVCSVFGMVSVVFLIIRQTKNL
jgi:hypothetical protein